MPSYCFICGQCGFEKQLFYSTLPSVEKQRTSKCDQCDADMMRDMASEGFFAVGGTNYEVQKQAEFAMVKVDVGGRPTPVFKDNNGRIREVRNSRDLDVWQRNNSLGKPRMVEWRNPITGNKSMVPQQRIMRADPKTGDPIDTGTTIRESERLVPLDSFSMPSESRTGRPLNKNGVLKQAKLVSNMIDPATGKKMDLMGDGPDVKLGIPERGVL